MRLHQLRANNCVLYGHFITTNVMVHYTDTIITNVRNRHGITISASTACAKQQSTYHCRLHDNVNTLFRARVAIANVDHYG